MNKVAIVALKPEGFNKEDLDCLNHILNIIPIGGLQTIYVGHKRKGEKIAKEYKKISHTHVELIRSYDY